MPDSLNVDATVGDESPLTIQLGVELSVLLLAVVIDHALLIDLGSEGLDEADVGVNAGLVVLVHAALVLIEASKVLLEVHELVLKDLVVALACSELSGLGHQLGDHSFLLCGCSSARSSIAMADLMLNPCLALSAFNLSDVVAGLLVAAIATLRAVCPQWTSSRVSVFLHFCFFVGQMEF